MSACQHILSSAGNFLPRETGSLAPGGLRICSSKVLGDLKGLCACNVESLVPLSPLWGPEFSHPRIKECFFFFSWPSVRGGSFFCNHKSHYVMMKSSNACEYLVGWHSSDTAEHLTHASCCTTLIPPSLGFRGG